MRSRLSTFTAISLTALYGVLLQSCEPTPQEQAAARLREAGIVPTAYADALTQAVASGHTARMQLLLGSNALAATPVVMPFSTAQITASW